MLIFLGFLVLCFTSGNMLEDENHAIYIPKKAIPSTDEDGPNDGWYCYSFTWLGKRHDKNTFPDLINKTCSDYFGNSPTLCVDPMTVTRSGRKPDFDYIRKNHFREATCKLSEDRVCAKYTIYYNGVASHVVRYCTRIDVESEGPLRSGCLTSKNGSYEFEVCACMSGHGEGGICNHSTRRDAFMFIPLTCIVLFVLVYDHKYIG